MNTGNTPKISWYSALVVAVLLVFAALAKWLYPLPQPFYLGQIAVFTEILMAVLILIFHRQIFAWFGIALMFSLWLGYALFWFIQREPCGCFGAMEAVASSVGLGLDLFMVALALINMACLEAKKKRIFLAIISSFLLIIIGLWLGSYVFYVGPASKAKEAFLLEVKPVLPRSNVPSPASPSEPTVPSRPELPSPGQPSQPQASPALPKSTAAPGPVS